MRSLVIFFVLSAEALAANPIALVYRGKGSCTDGCSEAAAEVPALMGYQVKYVTSRTLKKESFEGAALWIQPGGNAIKASDSLGTEGLSLIREYIREGGRYVGFCAGAFLADKTVDDEGKKEGLGILPIETYDYPIDSNYPNGIIFPIVSNGGVRQIFFNGGGSFLLNPENRMENLVEILATYQDSGAPATISVKFGKGKVVVSGFHPEATQAWRSQTNLVDPDGLDLDLAQEMIQRALQN